MTSSRVLVVTCLLSLTCAHGSVLWKPGAQGREDSVMWKRREHSPGESVAWKHRQGAATYELTAEEWLAEFNSRYRDVRHNTAVLEWNYSANITEHNGRILADFNVRRTKWLKQKRREGAQFPLIELDPLTKRQFVRLGKGSTVDTGNLAGQISSLLNRMREVYNTGAVCVLNGTCYSGEPDLVHFMERSRDPDQLFWAWRAWRDQVGPKLRPLYRQFVELSNMEVHANGGTDLGAGWRHELGDRDLESHIEQLWRQVEPLYVQLHAYVRRRLAETYGMGRVTERGAIPAHLLGNMWAQQWDALYDLLIPYPNAKLPDVTASLREKGFTPRRMFELADSFYQSLGMEPMTPAFWNNSILEKPRDGRKLVCHPSSINMFDGDDFRIRMCTEVTDHDLFTIHHEMGHVQYFMNYRHLPVLLQDGANSAFHEAVGDTVYYSVATPQHLAAVGLVRNSQATHESDMNFLMKQALLKIPLLPFALLVDKWRWSVFSGETPEDEYNRRWWQLRFDYQGVKPPVSRSEADFDPGAKFHIPDNTPYIRYYISTVLQVQFHKALCEAMWAETGSGDRLLHHCDIYKSKAAGDKFRSMLSLGAAVPWRDVLQTLTGQRDLDIRPLVEYYQPLYDWLVQDNAAHGQKVGWV